VGRQGLVLDQVSSLLCSSAMHLSRVRRFLCCAFQAGFAFRPNRFECGVMAL
jgi:hypothetical protein